MQRELPFMQNGMRFGLVLGETDEVLDAPERVWEGNNLRETVIVGGWAGARCVTFSSPLPYVPTTKVAAWGPSAKRPPSWTPLIYKAIQFSPVREGARLAEGSQAATLVVGT